MAISPADDFESVEQKSRILAALQTKVIIALGNIGVSRPDVIAFLEQGVKDRSQDVREASTRVLKDLKNSKN